MSFATAPAYAPRSTPHSAANQAFSDAAHTHALRVLYPALFAVEPHFIQATDCTITGAAVGNADRAKIRASVLDGELGIDKILKVRYGQFDKPLVHSIQERFRKPEFARIRDLTITEVNPNTNQPSELYKLLAQWFVYGYFDSEKRVMVEAVACPVPSLIAAIVHGQVPFTRQTNPRTGQPFVCVGFDDLRGAKLVDLHICKDEVVFSTLSDAFETEEAEPIYAPGLTGKATHSTTTDTMPQVITGIADVPAFWRAYQSEQARGNKSIATTAQKAGDSK